MGGLSCWARGAALLAVGGATGYLFAEYVTRVSPKVGDAAFSASLLLDSDRTAVPLYLTLGLLSVVALAIFARRQRP